eukprot:873469-Rhodomonas_salina.1
MSAPSLSPIPAAAWAFTQIACVGLLCWAAASTRSFSNGSRQWSWGDSGNLNSLFCHTLSPWSRALVLHPHHSS